MTVIDDDAKDRLRAMLLEAENAPSLPAVAMEVLRISQDEEASLDDLAEVIALDPALAARLMRYSNSSLYNPGSEVSTLQRAAMLLGLKTVQLMALSFSLTDGMPKSGSGNFNYNRFWRRSSVRAVAARSISLSVGSLMPDEAFLCGLIFEFGQIVLAECLPTEFNQVLEASPAGLPGRALETKLIGYDHVDTLEALLIEWKFPQSIRCTLSSALRAENIDRDREPLRFVNANVLTLACVITDMLTLESPSASLQKLENQALERLGLSAGVIDGTLDSLEKGVLELDQLLGLKLPKGKSIGDMLGHARSRQLSLTKEDPSRVSTGREIHAELAEGMEEEDEVNGPDAFEYYLSRSIEARLGGATNFPIGLLYLDINNIEELPSDAPLGTLGLALGEVVRSTDLWARISEGQFGVIMNESSPITLRRQAERVLQALREIESADPDANLSRTQVTIGGACLGPVRAMEDADQIKNLARQLAFKALSKAAGTCYVHPQQLRSHSEPRQAG